MSEETEFRARLRPGPLVEFSHATFIHTRFNHFKIRPLLPMPEVPASFQFPGQTVVLHNDLCLFLQKPEPVLRGSGIIVPRAQRETVFDLIPEEWQATYDLLQHVKTHLDAKLSPDGYNVGWNNGTAAGQTVFHVHLHVIPRFADEPRAGRGVRFHIKQPENRRDES